MNQLTLLLIENDQDVRKLISEYVAKADTITCTMVETGSLKEAEGLIPHHDIDVVLLNCELPDSQGLQTLRAIIAALPEAAVIIMANQQDSHDMASLCFHYGAQDYLENHNFSPASLQRTIRHGFERKRFILEKKDLLFDLNDALEKISILETYLPLCCGCNRILGTDNKWHEFSEYRGTVPVRKSDLQFCPDCES